MFGIGIPELLLIMALALILLGPDKLPQLAKQMARFIGELKKASDDFKRQLELDKIDELRELSDIKESVTSALSATSSDLDWPDDIKGHPSDSRALQREREMQPAHDNTPGGLGPEWKVASGQSSIDREASGHEEERHENRTDHTGISDKQTSEKA